MSNDDTVTHWIRALKAQDSEAADRLYHRYVERLKALVRKRLSLAARRVSDEDDIANMVLAEALDGIAHDCFHRVNDRQDLWKILLMLTDRRIADQMRKRGSLKRGAGRVRGESVFIQPWQSGSNPVGIDQIGAREPSHEFAVDFAEELQARMRQLEDQSLRQIVLWKLRGDSNAEIASKRGCTTRTIERKLMLVRRIWQQS